MTRHTPGPERAPRRVVVVVLDGAGVGAAPDAHLYGDMGANTIGSVLDRRGPLEIDTLLSLGLGRILGHPGETGKFPGRACHFGRMAPQSPGKDTTSGHWELAGLILEKPFPLYPGGFPPQIIEAFNRATGRKALGNRAASGTQIIEELGREHLSTGGPIVYTSADSVFQVAAHTAVVPEELLYGWCLEARAILKGEHAVGRVIARPFTGNPGAFRRTAGRRDYSLPPPGETLLDLAAQGGLPVAVIGKVADIFAHRGITVYRPGGGNETVVRELFHLFEGVEKGLIWATLGDFDTLYGHRNDCKGFARALELFDIDLARMLAVLGEGDLLMITADHGCDPTFPTTDHTREYVPLLAWGPNLERGVDLATLDTMADLAASAGYWLGLPPPLKGRSFIQVK